MRPIKFRAWMKHTTDNRWRWAYDKAEERLLSSESDLFNSDDERAWRNEYLEQWDKEHQQSEILTIKYLMCVGEEFGIYLNGKNVSSHGYEVLSVMQFTGLHDKNGKLIFEGDIVRFFAIEKEGLWQYPAKVIYDEKVGGFAYWFEEKGHNMNPVPLNFPQADVEVLGNIYENADFLK